MNPLESILEAIAWLERGSPQEADLALRRCLGAMLISNEHFPVMDEAAQLIWPDDKPKEALAKLKAYMENINVEGCNGTRT